jgi:hypothetical protein
MSRYLWVVLSVLLGCNKGILDLGNGEETDARFTADVYTWPCAGTDVEWMGALGFDVVLVYTPDNLSSRDLPAVGTCELGVSMFSLDTLEGGTDIPEADAPKWTTGDDEGRLDRQLEGLYHDDVFKNVYSRLKLVGMRQAGKRALFKLGEPAPMFWWKP